MVALESREGALLIIHSYVRGGYFKVGRRKVFVGREAGRGITVEECELRVCVGVVM